jgi:membrane-bound lytic murein transglycosylase A
VSLSPRLVPISFPELPGWQTDKGIAVALDAFTRSAKQVLSRPYSSGSLGIRFEAFAEAYDAATSLLKPINDQRAREFFETFFVPYRVFPEAGVAPLVTGFYEPEVKASLTPSDRFSQPLYRIPEDLVELADPGSHPGWDPSFRFAMKTASGISPYFDREAIDRGALKERGLELCWLHSKVDAFFIHVQGAARLSLPGGRKLRVTYAAKNGHPFTGIGKKLAEMGEIPLELVTMQTIRKWLVEHPQRVDEILWKNRSYIFFRETTLGDPELGPVAAAKVQLTPGRSIAVDRELHTFGTPLFIDAPDLEPIFGTPFQRLMIAQDTGTAIVGAARGDLFTGTGDEAGELAGVVRHNATFHVLVPRSLSELQSR